MNGSLKAIQIFLPSGDPHGIRIAELGGSNVQVTDVPRRFLGDYAAVPDSVQSGVYLLLDDANPPRQVYVAHGEPLLPQLTAHDAHRPGWHRALVVTSRLAELAGCSILPDRVEGFKVNRLASAHDGAPTRWGNRGTRPAGLLFNLDDFVDFFDYSDFVFRFEAGCD